MSNWFERNPTKSVIVHTLIVAAATWAAFIFVFDESKIQLSEAKISKAEAESKEVYARNSVLVTRIEYLTKENEKIYRWLEGTQKTIPYYEKEVASLNNKLKKLKIIIGTSSFSSQAITPTVEGLYELTKSRKSGTSFVDPKTNVVFSAKDIGIDKTAFVNISLPDGIKIKEEKVAPGETWKFSKFDTNYLLILNSIDWAAQSYKASVIELPKENTLNK